MVGILSIALAALLSTADPTSASPSPSISISTTVATSLTRTFPWKVATSVVGSSSQVTADDTAIFHYDTVATKGAGVDSNRVLSGQITVSNTGTAPADNLVVTDSVPRCTIFAPNSQTPYDDTLDLAGGATAVFPYRCPLDVGRGGTITASVTWDGQATAVDSAAVPYRFGNAQVTTVHDCVEVTESFDGAPAAVLASNVCASGTFPTSHPVTVPTAGCVTVPSTGTVLTDTSTAEVTACRAAADITVATSARTSLRRTWTWNITEVVAGPARVTQPGGPATFAYTVAVSRGGSTDDGFKVAGDITVHNSSGTTAEDVQFIDNLCSVFAPGTTLPYDGTHDVPPGQRLVFPYDCDMPNGDAGINTATVTWDDNETPLDSNDAAYHFGNATVTEADECAAVTEGFDGGAPDELTANICASAIFNYSRHVPVPPDGCRTFRNVAIVDPATSHDEKTASAGVEVCAAPVTADTTEPEGEVVGGPGDVTTTTTVPELAFTAEPESASAELPRTGSNVITTVLFGVAALAPGVPLIVWARRRRRALTDL